MTPVHRVLIIQTAYLGDVILATPLIRAARELWPEAEVDFLCIPQTGPLLQGHPLLSRVLVYDKRCWMRALREFGPTVRTLRTRRYDVALVPHPSFRSSLLAALAGARVRVGFDRNAGRWLYTRTVPYRRGLHEVERNLGLLAPFGRQLGPLSPELFPTERDRDDVVRRLNGVAKPFVAVAPGSVWATKRWLPEGFAQVCRRVREELGFGCVLIGGPEDRELAESIASLAGTGAVNLAGELTPLQSVAAIATARLLLTNDTAPLHMASATKTPVVAIFGPTVPAFGFGPYRVPNRIAEIQLSCRPCAPHGGRRCPLGTFDCMQKLSAEHVYGLVTELLEETEHGAK